MGVAVKADWLRSVPHLRKMRKDDKGEPPLQAVSAPAHTMQNVFDSPDQKIPLCLC